MHRRGVHTLRPRWCLLVALVALSLVSAGCRAVLSPLNEGQVQQSSEGQSQDVALLRVAACWSGLPLTQDAAAALSTEDSSMSIDIAPANSAAAEELVRAGQADVALVAEAFDSNMSTQRNLDARYAPLKARLLALDALVVIVHKDSPLRGLDTEQLANLFAGRILDWSELQGGNGLPEIVALQEGASSRALFEQRIMGDQALTSAALLMPHDQGVIDYVAEHPNAIGYVSAAYLDDRVKPLAIDGHSPTRNEIQAHRYPLVSSLILLTSPQAPREAAKWQSYLLTGQGRALVDKLYAPAQ